jgi:glutamate synthase (NADPH/NADH) small chain
MPARAEEIHHAEEEGIIFELLTAPVRFLGDDRGWVQAMECVRMELGEPDASGRRRPVAMPGSEFVMETDMVIVSIGTSANPLIPATTPGLNTNRWGYIVTDDTGKTSKEGVWAGGDIVTGSATVILAMGAGRKAANAMHEYLLAR